MTARDAPGAPELPPIAGRVAFAHVDFSYTGMDDPEDRVLHDVSFQVEPGQTVALVGPTGRAARAEGFKRMELMATMAGEPLYRACGYEPDTYLMDDRGGVPVPLLRMTKWL